MKKIAAAALCCLLLLCAGCGAASETPAATSAVTGTPAPTLSSTPAPTPEPTPEPTPQTATLALCGDLVLHTPLNADALTADGSYDYAPLFGDAAHLIAEADLALCCLETVFTGDGVWTGYPTFHSPDDLAYSLAAVGFDLVNTASNHAMDGWQDGLIRTLDVLDAAGLSHVGTYRTQAERDADSGILTETVNGITIAFLDYTYGTNGFPVYDYPYAVNIYYTDYLTDFRDIDYDTVSADMAAARALETDLIAVTVHWGAEYLTGATDPQREFADFLFGQGADLVIGGHPHVPEPMELRAVTDADGTTRTGFLCYCLGNLLSAQNSAYTDLTAVVELTLTKDPATGETAITDWGYTPMVLVDLADYGISGGDWRFRLWNLEEAVADYESGDDRGVMTSAMYGQFVQDLADCRRIFGELEAPVTQGEASA